MKSFLLILFIAFTGSGCLKNQVTLDYSGIQPVVIVPNSNWPNGDPYSPIQDSVHGVTILHLKARLSYATTVIADIKVRFEKDTALLTDYNSKWSVWGLNYAFLPDSCYQVGSLDASIPANTQQVDVPITLFPDKIGGSQHYLLAFTIADAGGYRVSSNEKSIVYTLSTQ
jgi:hypothetical protein